MGIFPWSPDLPSSYLEQDPIWVHTNQPHLLGGSSTSYDKDHYPINFNYTFRGLTDDLPVCFNFPSSHTKSFIIPTKNGCIGAFKKAILTDSPTSKFTYKKGDWSVWILQARMPRVLDPYKSLFFNAPPKYPNCIDVAPLDIVGKTIDHRLGYPPWKSCTYNSRTDYIILGGGNYSAQDWSNPNPSQDPKSVHGYTTKFSNWKDHSIPWPLAANRWHHNQFVPPMLSYTAKGKTWWQPEIWKALAATSLVTLSRPENDSTYSVLACLPSPYTFLCTNDSKRLHIQMNYSGGPNIVYCEQCMLSSCLTPQYNISSFVVLQRPPHSMVLVTNSLTEHSEARDPSGCLKK